MEMRYVAVKTDGRVTVHMPHENGNYYTLCGMGGDDPDRSVDQEIALVPSGAKIDCLDCFQLWNVSRKYRIDDFISSHDKRAFSEIADEILEERTDLWHELANQ